MGIRQALSGSRPHAEAPEPKSRRFYPKPRERRVDPPEERALPPAAGAVRPTPGARLFRRSRWAVLVYALVFTAFIGIAGVTYTTYAFSKYQGLILPGVYIDTLPLGNQTKSIAGLMVFDQLKNMNQVPIVLTFGQRKWHPTTRRLGLAYDYNTTIDNAFNIGRTGNFWQNLFDRLPIRRHFSIRLLTVMNGELVHEWVNRALVSNIHRQMSNAVLVMQGDQATVILSTEGYHVNVPATLAVISNTIGKVDLHRVPVPITYIHPRITNSQASALASRVNSFLSHPPVLKLGHDLVKTSRSQLAPMISFAPNITSSGSSIVMNVDSAALNSYVSSLAASYDRQAQDPQSTFADGQVTVISPAVTGRTMDQSTAQTELLAAFSALRSGQTISVPATKVQPPPDPSNPALHGVTTPLAQAQTNFLGAPPSRGDDISRIAATLNNQLIPPGATISFNAYTGSSWPHRVYGETERTISGQIAPGSNGAMQQVATTFFRAAYSAGLTLVERHPHTYLLPWYQPPAGMDAIVLPNGADLSFVNNTGGYLLIQTKVDTSQQTVAVYVYARNTGWLVQVSSPRRLRTHPHCKQIVRLDPSLPPGTRTIQQYPHDGAGYVVLRTVKKPHSHLVADTLTTNYQAANEIVLVGPSVPTPTPQTPTPTTTPGPTPTPVPTGTITTPVPTVSPTTGLR
jgi:vancomycin resistance protein YoaR